MFTFIPFDIDKWKCLFLVDFWGKSMAFLGEHITDIYITETGTTELENLSHNIIDIFIIET